MTNRRSPWRRRADLQDLDEGERRSLLAGPCGLLAQEVEEVETMLSAMPTLWVTAQCVVEGPEVRRGALALKPLLGAQLCLQQRRTSMEGFGRDADSWLPHADE